MLEKALFKVPNESGFFEAPDNAEFSESDTENDDIPVAEDDDKF